MVDAVPLGRVISGRLRELRAGVPQETVAAEARQLGLDWSRATVADIELGRRQLSIGELLLLPEIFGRAGVWARDYRVHQHADGSEERLEVGKHPVGLADLIPNDDRPILLAGSTRTSAQSLHALLERMSGARLPVEGVKASVGEEAADQAGHLPRLWCQRIFEAIREHRKTLTPPDPQWHPDDDETFWPSIGRDAADDATRKAAAVLGVPPLAVALAARARWNGVWGLTAEREHRLAVKLRGMQRETEPRRKLQALRGHITRELLDDLRPLLKDVTTKRRRKTR